MKWEKINARSAVGMSGPLVRSSIYSIVAEHGTCFVWICLDTQNNQISTTEENKGNEGDTSGISLRIGDDISYGGKRGHVPALQILLGKTGGLRELSRVVKPPVITHKKTRPAVCGGTFLVRLSHLARPECSSATSWLFPFSSIPGVCYPRLSSLEPSARNTSCFEQFSVYQ